MSAFRYLIFVAGVVLVAVIGAVANQFVTPLLTQASDHATSGYAQDGVAWMTQLWDFVALILLALLVFGLLVGIIIRRRSVTRGI